EVRMNVASCVRVTRAHVSEAMDSAAASATREPATPPVAVEERTMECRAQPRPSDRLEISHVPAAPLLSSPHPLRASPCTTGIRSHPSYYRQRDGPAASFSDTRRSPASPDRSDSDRTPTA